MKNQISDHDGELNTGSVIRRKPDSGQAENVKQAVTRWCDRIKKAKKHWDASFKRMRDNQDFAMGKQWPHVKNNPHDQRYVVNIVLRHIQQRVAALYAKNPKAASRRRERLMNTVWDGTQESLKVAHGQVQMMTQMLPAARRR